MQIMDMMLLAAITAVLSAQAIYHLRSSAIRFWGVAVCRPTSPMFFRRMQAAQVLLVAASVGTLHWFGVR